MARKYKSRRRRKRSFRKKVLSVVKQQAEKKAYNVELASTFLPVYTNIPPSDADIPFLSLDLISGQTGLQTNGRVGSKTNGIVLDYRATFEFSGPVPAMLPVFISMLVVRWPQKLTVAHPLDMTYVLRELSSTGVSSGFAQLFNSSYEIAGKQTYDVLMRKSFTMVNSTTSAIKTINRKFRLNGVRGKQTWDREQAGSILPPRENSICVYIMCNNYLVGATATSPIAYSHQAKYIFTDD